MTGPDTPETPQTPAPAPAPAPAPPPEAAHAREARLWYVNANDPGIRREKNGEEWAYFMPDGTPVTDEATLTRIRMLAIPPAYVNVWICVKARGHLQCTGLDARGRRQYRYHKDW